MERANLTLHADGLNACDLGVIGAWQYAVTVADGRAADVFRRRAEDVGSYGGWRWECNARHPAQYPHLPDLAALTTRIAAVTAPAAS